jgi:hypothetical protein
MIGLTTAVVKRFTAAEPKSLVAAKLWAAALSGEDLSLRAKW